MDNAVPLRSATVTLTNGDVLEGVRVNLYPGGWIQVDDSAGTETWFHASGLGRVTLDYDTGEGEADE